MAVVAADVLGRLQQKHAVEESGWMQVHTGRPDQRSI
jgi:hypothetical protein